MDPTNNSVPNPQAPPPQPGVPPSPPPTPPVPPLTPPAPTPSEQVTEIDNPPVAPPSEPPKKKGLSKKLMTALLIVVALLIAVYAGIYIFMNDQLNKVTNTNQPTPTPARARPTPTPTPFKIDNVRSLFSMQLPQGWIEDSISTNPVQFLNYDVNKAPGREFNPVEDKGLLKIEVYFDNSGKSLASLLAESKEGAKNAIGEENFKWTETSITIDGQQGVKVDTANPGFSVYVKHPSDPVNFIISFGLDFDRYPEIANQILSTFKFNSPTASLTCTPRPACLDATPRCLMPETPDMCPATTTKPSTKPQVACAQDAKICSDGSYVGRTGPNCEFAACP
jgi:hypothetical protein